MTTNIEFAFGTSFNTKISDGLHGKHVFPYTYFNHTDTKYSQSS